MQTPTVHAAACWNRPVGDLHERRGYAKFIREQYGKEEVLIERLGLGLKT